MAQITQQQSRAKFYSTHFLILAFISISFLFSSARVLSQDVGIGDLLDGLNDAEEVKNFAEDPGGYIKGKVSGKILKSMEGAVFGEEMSYNMNEVFERVFEGIENEEANIQGGKCPRAAWGNAWNVIMSLKNKGKYAWFFSTLWSIEKDIAGGKFKSVAGEMLKKTADRWLRKKFGERIAESYSITSTRDVCTYVALATIDYVRGGGTYEVLIVADCKCRPVILPNGGHGVVAGWRLYASGSAKPVPGDNFINANILYPKRFEFNYNCKCDGDDPGLHLEGGSDLILVGGGNELQLSFNCDEIVTGIAETEMDINENQNRLDEFEKNNNGGKYDNEIGKLKNDLNKLEVEQQARFDEYRRANCGGGDKRPDTHLSPLLQAYFRCAFRGYHGITSTYKRPKSKSRKTLKEDLKLLNGKSNTSGEEKVGSFWTPPTGTTRIAAVGTVRDEEVMMTSRGGSIGGTVTVENEDGEELAVAVPDEDGHFTIDFSDLAIGTIATTIILTQLDASGSPLTSTTIDYIPGEPLGVTAPPTIVSTDGSYLENNQIYQLEGTSLGESTEVVITDETGEVTLLETVSSSTSLVQYFLDAPLGETEMIVRNEFGSSEPIEANIYEFNVTAGKMNLVKNEKTNITAKFEGLPEGTKIIFTNISKNVTVKPKGRANVSGNNVIFKVKESIGEVSMTLKAKRAGGWMINYRLEFPVSD